MIRRERRRRRKKSVWCYARNSLKQILQHPTNRRHRLQALSSSMSWQMKKRLCRTGQVVSIVNGIRVKCYPDSSCASKIIYCNGLYDYAEMLFLLRFLRPGDSVIDCGANIGIYSLLAAARVGPCGNVEAIDPLPKNIKRIIENASLNEFQNIHCHNVAVSDFNGVSRFTTELDVSNRVAIADDSSEGLLRVSTTRLDDLFGPERAFAYGKLDVEGSEYRALVGAERMLSAANPPVWQIEGVDSLLGKQGSSREELFTWLADHSYTLGYYDPFGNNFIWQDLQQQEGNNYLAVAESHRDFVIGRLALCGDSAAWYGEVRG